MQRIYSTLRVVVAAICGWETYAIATRGMTFSKISRRYPWVAPILIGGLTLHLLAAIEDPSEKMTGAKGATP